MRLIVLLVVLGLTTYANAGSGSDSTSDSAEYIHIEYAGFEKMYVSFASKMAIVFNSTAYDLIMKINQFNTMPGIQPILALSTLYGQYIPPYAVCRDQVHIQSKKLPKLISAPNPNKIFIQLTQEQVNTLYAAWESIENSDVIAIQGIIDRINGLETMLYDPDFKFNNEYIFTSSAIATSFYNTFANWALGNEGIVEGLQNLVNMGLSTLNAQQNNPYSQYVLGVVFKFLEQNLAIYKTITNTIKQTVSSSMPSKSSSTYTAKIDTQVESIITSANTMSNQFLQLAAICVQLENAIINPPPISSNESS